jgi:hypothetical protein
VLQRFDGEWRFGGFFGGHDFDQESSALASRMIILLTSTK